MSKLSCLAEGYLRVDSLIGERDSLGCDEPGEVSASIADRAIGAASPGAFVTHQLLSPSCPSSADKPTFHQPRGDLVGPTLGAPEQCQASIGVMVKGGTETICQMHQKVRHRGCPP